ncbi:MAG TPA: SEC-C metal-binding domain-containing protein [Planctomycetota bacterium]|nr:SEC-C metal-binding domain-containing protein [Planctomycetota bacterium]
MCPCGSGRVFKHCCLISGRFDGSVRDYYFQGVIPTPRSCAACSERPPRGGFALAQPGRALPWVAEAAGPNPAVPPTCGSWCSGSTQVCES